jgi:hypothetical protein
MNTQVRYHQRRLADVAAALRLSRTQTSREQGPRAQLAQHQQQRLETVVRHAATHSPFYRRRLAETGALGDGPVQLQRLPVLDKSLLMEHFDELVCDPRLRRDQLLGWVGVDRREQRGPELVGGQDVQAPVEHERGRADHRVQDALHRGPDSLSGRPAARRAGRASGAEQVEQVGPLGVVELQGVGDGVDDAVGDAGGVAALQPGVVLAGDAG